MATSLLYSAIAILTVAAATALWLLIVWRVYRLKREPPEPVEVVARDGWRLTMYRRAPSQRRFAEPVLLCHGIAANHRNLDFEPPFSLAHFLADAGFECFSIEWRGTGQSRGAPRGRRATDYSIDDHIREDGPAFLEAALRITGAKRAFWVGHSLGGLIGYGVAQAEAGPALAGLVTIGSPAFYRYPSFMRHVVRLVKLLSWPHAVRQRVFSIATAPFLGHVTLPLTDVVVNPKHVPPKMLRKIYAQVVSSVSARVVKQFDDWLRYDAFRSMDGKVDYRAGMARIAAPLLIAGGSSDRLAPPEVVTAAFDAAGSSDKTLMIFGRENGDALDYGHGDLLFGMGAPTEVYPRVQSWLQEHATALQGDASGSNTTGVSQAPTQDETMGDGRVDLSRPNRTSAP